MCSANDDGDFHHDNDVDDDSFDVHDNNHGEIQYFCDRDDGNNRDSGD